MQLSKRRQMAGDAEAEESQPVELRPAQTDSKFYELLGRAIAAGSQCEFLWKLVGGQLVTGPHGLLSLSATSWQHVLNVCDGIAVSLPDSETKAELKRLHSLAEKQIKPRRNSLAHGLWSVDLDATAQRLSVERMRSTFKHESVTTSELEDMVLLFLRHTHDLMLLLVALTTRRHLDG